MNIGGSFVTEEICQGHNFEPSCTGNAIIFIQSAKYGRVRFGKCLQEQVGPIGCSEDVSGYIDSLCFGQSECVVDIPNTHLIAANPCSASYVAYLEVSYECIEGMQQYCILIICSYKSSLKQNWDNRLR